MKRRNPPPDPGHPSAGRKGGVHCCGGCFQWGRKTSRRTWQPTFGAQALASASGVLLGTIRSSPPAVSQDTGSIAYSKSSVRLAAPSRQGSLSCTRGCASRPPALRLSYMQLIREPRASSTLRAAPCDCACERTATGCEPQP